MYRKMGKEEGPRMNIDSTLATVNGDRIGIQ